jgi:ribosome maturation factor RimP
MATVERARGVIAPILDDLSLDLYDLEHTGGVLRVLVDRPGGVALDDLTTATRLISRALDDADSMPGAYTLEVSSPGLERPLRTPAHFAGAIGEEVSVKTVPAHDGERRIRGRLSSVSDDAVVVVDETGHEHTVDLADIEKARTVFTWGPADDQEARPGHSKRSRSQKARA